MELYTVKPRDTLREISRRFGVPMQLIIQINGLDNPDELIVGMVLVIPQKTVKETYTVKPGDTLWSISKKYNLTVNEIILLNNLMYPYNVYPGQILIVYIKPLIETLGYYDPSNLTNKEIILERLGEYLTYLGLFDFPMTETGEISGTIDDGILQVARQQSVALLPVITNLKDGNFDRQLAYSILSNPDRLNVLIVSIIDLLDHYHLIGVIIDIENLAPEDRSIFTTFIQALYEGLKKVNKLLILNMPAKWEEWPDEEWVGFFDYNALGPYIDRAAIMTYEFGWRSGPPRPTVPMNYITRTLDYAITNNIPANKILLGLTLYGYDWELPDTPQNLAATVTLPKVWSLARKYRAEIKFDYKEQQAYVDYIDDNDKRHKVWFENARGHLLKYQLVKKYNLKGVFYWLLNQPFESTWYILSKLFRIKKY